MALSQRGDAVRVRLARRNTSPGRIWARLQQRARRAWAIGAELARAGAGDARAAWRAAPARVVRVQAGTATPHKQGRVAIYAHYSPRSRVHPMVLRQITEYSAAGFDIVFVTMSHGVPAGDWEQVCRLSALLIERRSFGRDFGAWKDSWALVRRMWPDPGELLLVNDSVLGPIRPIHPVLAAMRRAGPGLVGLTESLQGPRHLQSYFLLALGSEAVADVGRFLEGLRLSSSRWLMVRRGEYALTSFMRQRGHPVRSLVPDSEISGLVPPTIAEPPFNPTHHGWRALVESFDFPFIKTDLLVRNPNRVAGVDDWPELLRPGEDVDAAMIADYLAPKPGDRGRA